MRKQFIIVSALFVGMAVSAQKSEIKTAEKAVKSSDYPAALSALSQAEGLINEANAKKYKAKFLYLKAMATYANGASKDKMSVGEAFKEVISYEKEMGKQKYSTEVEGLLSTLIFDLKETATDFYKEGAKTKDLETFNVAGKGFYEAYLLNPADTSSVDNAAMSYYAGKKYDKSMELYKFLLEKGYTGIYTQFIAKSKETGEVQLFNDEKTMKFQVKVGLVVEPETVVKESRRAGILARIARIHIAKEDNDNALIAIGVAREANPGDYSLLIDEANIYYRKGDTQKFKEKLEEAITLNPTDATLYYNVGVMNLDQKNIEEAIRNFKKAVELKPDYGDAYNNIGAAILQKAEVVVEEMNENSMDFDKYDAIKANKLDPIYREALPFYEKSYELSPSDSVRATLNGIYENLEMEKRVK
ncbi:MAG: tetratricopeptide repeat protein [Flavobacteriaceae bacterium]|nr:tetratricopeptide repeat protein [Flavobacteriaceae bacterium]